MSNFPRVVMFKIFTHCFTAAPITVLCAGGGNGFCASLNEIMEPEVVITESYSSHIHSIRDLISGCSVCITKLELANTNLIGCEQ